MEFLTRAFPERREFLDLKDASSAELLRRVLQAEINFPDLQEAAKRGASLNMTHLALNMSRYVNGVAKLHGEVSRRMFPQVPIEEADGVETLLANENPAGSEMRLQDQLFDRYPARSWLRRAAERRPIGRACR